MIKGNIIDFRCRPPYSEFLKGFLYADLDYMRNFSAHFGMPVPASAKVRNLDLCLFEMDEAGIAQGVKISRTVFMFGRN